MGCNCKGSRPQTRTKIVENTTIIQPEPITLEYMIGDEKPPFSRQDVQRAIDFLNGITSSFEEKIYLYEFHNKYHREQLKPSCSVCLPRIQTRVFEMSKILDKWESNNP